jgi:hypothetical protein
MPASQRPRQCANKNTRIHDATQLCAFQQGLQHRRRESPGLRFASGLVKKLLQGPLFAANNFTKPKTEKSLHLAFIVCRRRVVGLRRLRIKRDGDGGIYHGCNQHQFYDKMILFPSSYAESA